MAQNRFDEFYLTICKETGGIEGLLKSFFDFMISLAFFFALSVASSAGVLIVFAFFLFHIWSTGFHFGSTLSHPDKQLSASQSRMIFSLFIHDSSME